MNILIAALACAVAGLLITAALVYFCGHNGTTEPAPRWVRWAAKRGLTGIKLTDAGCWYARIGNRWYLLREG